MNPDQIEQLLTSYALGDLDADTARTVEAHLEHNEAGRQALTEIRETIGLLQRALQAPLPAGVDTLDPARRASVLAPPEAEAAASRPPPPPIPWFTGWLRMAATLTLTGGAVWIGVRQFAGESNRAVRSETDVMNAPMDIALVDESELTPPAKPAAPTSRPQSPRDEVGANAVRKSGERQEDARQEYGGFKGKAAADDLAVWAGEPQQTLKATAKEVSVDDEAKKASAPAPAPAPSTPAPLVAARVTAGKMERSNDAEALSARRELAIQVVGEEQVDQLAPADSDAPIHAENFDAEPAPAKDMGAEGRSANQALVQTESPAAATALPPAAEMDKALQSRMSKAGPVSEQLPRGETRLSGAAGGGGQSQPAPGAVAATPAEPEAVPPLSGVQFDGNLLRNDAITGYSQSASREAAQFAALEQNLSTFNSVGGKMQINTSLYPGVRTRPGSVGEDSLRSRANAKIALAAAGADSAAGAVFQFGFVHPFNLAAMLEETVAGGRVNRAELGAQPERWAASFSYAVSGRAMGDMRAGVRRVASPENGHEVLVVMVDSGEAPVAVSMRVVLRSDAASRSRLVGYESNVTLIPGDFAPPASLAVAVIDLENPRAGAEPLGRLEVSWTTPDGRDGRETLPLQDAGLGEADAAWAAAMAMTADAMRRGDEEAQQAWGRIVATHLRNRPGTPEARVVEALRRILPAAVPVPVFRKS